ncbi:F-box protein [Phanerochaete sordida]|uniref:F-box protein n=1 Tax=Phanerochaete sordida TaxID=48140 RepID=A0A9P3GCP0_9APHY|nr:F-box protein [Phanerochaete sordida]
MLSTLRRAESENLRGRWACEQAEKEQLEREIAKRQARIRELDIAMRVTRGELAMLAPVNMLPDDVMIDILHVAYLHDFPHCRADDGLYNTHSPIAFSQVCRRWRRLALGMPALWTCIHVTPQQTKGYPEMARLYITRSRNRALSISFICYSEPIELIPAFDVSGEKFAKTVWPRYRASWEVLLAHTNRWKHCALYSTFGFIASELADNLRGRILPRLEYFRHQLWGEETTGYPGIRFFAPNLKQVDLNNIYSGLPETDAFRRLRDLQLSVCGDVSEILIVLQHCAPSLERLSLREMDLYHDDATLVQPSIHLPRLRSVILHDFHEINVSATFISRVFRGATGLEELIVHDTGLNRDYPSHARFSFPQSISTLRYGATEPEWRIIRENLPAPCPELEELEFFSGAEEILHDVLDLYQSSTIVAWPRLRTLILEPYDDMDEDTLLRFIEYRVLVGRPLHTVKLSAETLQRLSSETLAKLSTHPTRLVSHAEDARSPPWDEPWDYGRNIPAYFPWNGSLEWWDQF